MQANGVPGKVTMDKSGANKAAIDEINASREIPMVVRQTKYLNNIVEQDHRAVKRMTKPMLGINLLRAPCTYPRGKTTGSLAISTT